MVYLYHAKLGTYGLVRFGLQMFPETWSTVASTLAIIGTVSVIYGALTAIAQKDIKRMVAYSSIGHMGYILVAAAGTQLSILGAVFQMIDCPRFDSRPPLPSRRRNRT
jgi:NAD(P)H-quinone oxidoreductase subunit 4